jgi:uncharacterized protein YijF (DUF1287 family)
MLYRVLFLFFALILYLTGGEVERFIDAARSQIGVTLYYDPSYVKLDYPMGDVDPSRGVCTDVVVRALRKLGIDLQERIYLDRKRYPARYTGLYGGSRADPNIDHRRVKNIQAYLQSRSMRVRDRFRPGDIVIWKLPGSNLDHIGICSDRMNEKGEPYIIHNVGYGTKEEDLLREYIIVDHFRIFGK